MSPRSISSFVFPLVAFACLFAGGCDRSEGLKLLGAWEGKPAEADVGVAGDSSPVESCRFEFLPGGQANITLRVRGQGELASAMRWQVVDSGLERLTVQLSLPESETAGAEEAARVRQLELEFEGPDRIVAKEVGGDYRVPAMILLREGSAAAEEAAQKATAGEETSL